MSLTERPGSTARTRARRVGSHTKVPRHALARGFDRPRDTLQEESRFSRCFERGPEADLRLELATSGLLSALAPGREALLQKRNGCMVTAVSLIRACRRRGGGEGGGEGTSLTFFTQSL